MSFLKKAVSTLLAVVTAVTMLFAGSVTAEAEENISFPQTAKAGTPMPEYTLEGYYISESEYRIIFGGIPAEEYEYLKACDTYFKGEGAIDTVISDPKNWYVMFMISLGNFCSFSYGPSLDDSIHGYGWFEKKGDFYSYTLTFDLNSEAKEVIEELAKNTETEKMEIRNYYSSPYDGNKYNYYNGESSIISNTVKYNFSGGVKGKSSSAAKPDSTAESGVTLKITTLTAKRLGEKIKLSWKKVDGAEKYQIYYREKGDSKYKKLTTVSGSKTSYSASKLDKTKTYQFKIRSYVESNGKKVYSKFSKIKTITVK